MGRKGRIDAAVHPTVIGHGRVHNKEGIVFFELFDELFYIVYMDFGAKISCIYGIEGNASFFPVVYYWEKV